MKSHMATAIDYAKRTTGTLLKCDLGVFSGDGKRGLSGSYAISRFLQKHCKRFTSAETENMLRIMASQERRCKRYAVQAIECGKYESAIRLCEKVKDLAENTKELQAGYKILYRINGGAA